MLLRGDAGTEMTGVRMCINKAGQDVVLWCVGQFINAADSSILNNDFSRINTTLMQVNQLAGDAEKRHAIKVG